jgi:hypothetical protein
MNQGGDWLSTPRPVSADPVGMAPHARRCGCYGTVLLCKLRRRGHSRPPSQAGGGRAEQSRAHVRCVAAAAGKETGSKGTAQTTRIGWLLTPSCMGY